MFNGVKRDACAIPLPPLTKTLAVNIAKLPEPLGTYDASAGCGPTGQKNGTNERCALTPTPFEIAHTHKRCLLFV